MKNPLQKAKDAQGVVRKYLVMNGFEVAEVSNVSANGIDILAIKNGKGYAVEVKSVIRGDRGSRVKKPHPKSDLVAVVLPNGFIHIELTSDWNRLCQKDGSRSLTRLVDFHELVTANKLIQLLTEAK